MNNSIKFLIDNNSIGERLDVYLARKISTHTRSYIKQLIKKNRVKVNKIIIQSPAAKLKEKDLITIDIIEAQNLKISPWKTHLDVIYEDKDIIIINKPKGMVVHPGAGNTNKTLVNALKSRFENNLSDLNGELRPGIIHRIDKETSGVLVVAKNNIAHSKIALQFSDHSIKRKYLCLAWGVLRPLNGRIVTLISRNKKNRQLMSVSEIKGKKAITNYKTIKVFNSKDLPKISLIECFLETGRTHQIRVHLKYKKTSILGDKQYGKKNIRFKNINTEFLDAINLLNGQALHAKTLEFLHPSTNKWISFNSDLPPDFKKMLNILNKLSS